MKKTMLAFSLVSVLSGLVHAQSMKPTALEGVYKVTIKNLTNAQILSPPVIATHLPGLKLFALGRPASPGIVAIAEDGTTTTLVSEIQASRVAKDIVVGGGGILPGDSQTYYLKAAAGLEISLATMLATTNDAFAAGTAQLGSHKKMSFYVPTYDSGSEANTESCRHIPGPPCGAHRQRAAAGAEGLIQLHPGIKGTADLSREMYGWEDPVAMVTVEAL